MGQHFFQLQTNLTHSYQIAHIKGRYISESESLISDTLEYTDNNGIKAILFSEDFEKAFDSVDHTFLFSVLESCWFGLDFIQWVNTFFNSESCVMNNGPKQAIFL